MPDAFLLQRQQWRDVITGRLGIDAALYDRYTALCAPHVTALRARKGSVLQAAGERATHFYWLGDGVVRRGHLSLDGNELTLGFMTEGDNTGSHSDLMGGLQGMPAREFFIAESAIEGWRIDWHTMQRQCEEHDFVRDYYVKVIEESIRRYATHMHIHSMASAEARLAAFRASFPGLEQRITQRALASYLGITTQYMSRLRRAA